MNTQKWPADLRVSMIQAPLHWHDSAANRAMFESNIAALNQPTDLIVLPEMFTSGFTQSASRYAENMEGESVSWMRRLAAETGAAITGSMIIEDNAGAYRNRLLMAHPDGGLDYYDKRHLFRMADEHNNYCAGAERVIIQYRGWRICPQICYDLRFPVWTRYRGDYDLLLYVANWPSPRAQAWCQLMRARAVENQCYVVAVNRIGSDGNGWQFSGDSAVINYLGDTVVDLGEQQGAATVALDFAALADFRQSLPFDQDADRYTLACD